MPNARTIGVLLGLLLVMGAGPSVALTLYVSPAGDDSWSGARAQPDTAGADGPFATPARALDEIERIHQTEGINEAITVVLGEGTYCLDSPLTLKPVHSGSAQYPVTIKAADNAEVVISGGFPISNWTREGGLLTAQLDTAAIRSYYFHQLFAAHERRTRARMPNRGSFFRTEGGFDDAPKSAIRYAAGDCRQWEQYQDAMVVLYLSWTAVNLYIESIDEGNRRIDFTAGMWWEVGKWEQDQRYYVENVYEALDTAGEWYLHPQTFTLSYYPRSGEDADNLTLVAPLMRRVLVFDGDYQAGNPVEWVSFQGIRFAHADWAMGKNTAANGQAHVSRNDAVVYAVGARNCALIDCAVGPGGTHGVAFGFGCADNRIERCEIHGLGGGGVYIGMTGGHHACRQMSDAERVHHNTIDNCYIHDMGHVFHGSVGAWIGNADHNTLSHNDICDIDYSGVSVGWCWGYNPSDAHHNVIECNHIHHLGQGELSDMGGVYTLGISPGTIVRDNHIHDVYAYDYGGWGLYTDQASSDIVMENNVVHDVKSNGFHQHFGELNTIRNNIFAFAGEGGVKRSKEEDHRSFIFERNIVYQDNPIMLKGRWTNDNFQIDYNCYWSPHMPRDFAGYGFSTWQDRSHDRHSLLADPLFVDADRRDFELRAGSPALQLGFEAIDIDAIGLYGDAEWTVRPQQDSHRPVSSWMKPVKQTLFAIHDFFDDFEQSALGDPPRLGIPHGGGVVERPMIAVSDLRAESGSHSLRFADIERTDKQWQPMLTYEPFWYHPGQVTVSFDLCLEPGTKCNHEWRDKLHGYPDNVGILLKLYAGQPLEANGMKLDTVPAETWMHVECSAHIDEQADAVYDLRIDMGDVHTEESAIPMSNAGWHVFSEAYFISAHNTAADFYVDNVHFVYEPDQSRVRGRSPVDAVTEGRRPRLRVLHRALHIIAPAGRDRIRLAVYRADGRVVLRRSIETGGRPGSQRIDLSHLPAGSYAVRLDWRSASLVRTFPLLSD